MRRRILICIAACLYYSGLVAFARWYARRGQRCLVILNYHRAAGGDLRRQLLYLRRHYRIMHVEAALEDLYACQKDWHLSSRGSRLPLVLTFDDGYRDNYTHAFALARELQIPLTIYLVPGYIESGKCFWWLESERLAQHARVEEVENEGDSSHRRQKCHPERQRRIRSTGAADPSLPLRMTWAARFLRHLPNRLSREQERAALARAIDARLRHARSVEEREAFLADVCEKLGAPEAVLDEEAPYLPLTWEQVREMDESGWVSFGAHTMHHPVLSCLVDPEELQREVEQCRVVLEQRLGHPIRSFAYPIGQMQHIGAAVIDAVRRAGYDWALTTSYGLNTPRSNPYLLKRVEVDVDQHWLVVAAEAAGLWGFFSRLRWLPFIRKHFTNSREDW
jgi:peptidoglycan/xylan/chitin deacetylase (PgdA/CDA1 family)